MFQVEGFLDVDQNIWNGLAVGPGAIVHKGVGWSDGKLPIGDGKDRFCADIEQIQILHPGQVVQQPRSSGKHCFLSI